MVTCFFIGHRDAPESLSQLVSEIVEHHIVCFGVSDFVVGHYGSFDRMAARAVIAAKARHPHIRLTLLLPYHPSVHPVELADGFDGSHYPPIMDGVPPRAAIVCANKYSIDHSDYLIAYARYATGGTAQMFEYAQKLSKKGLLHITNLADISE